MEKLAKAENVLDKVSIQSYHSQKIIFDLLKKSTIAILPNSKHGNNLFTSPIKLFEYFAMGLPIVASKIKGISSLFIDRKSGLYFEPENPQDLAIKIDELLNNKELKKITFYNLAIIKKYSWNNRAKTIVDHIRKTTMQ